jgi:hypothetical protein
MIQRMPTSLKYALITQKANTKRASMNVRTEPNAKDTRDAEEDEGDMKRREIKPKSLGEAG